jgi:hypothetical protein
VRFLVSRLIVRHGPMKTMSKTRKDVPDMNKSRLLPLLYSMAILATVALAAGARWKPK